MPSMGHGRAPGAAGELVQGQMPTGQDFLVSLPVDLWSEVRVTLAHGNAGITISDSEKTKTCRAVRALLDHLGWPELGARIEITSAIPVGKGMASSTADITAACLAVGDALGTAVSPETIAAVAGGIEPSDGVMHPGLVVFDHVGCKLIEALGEVPPLEVLVVDLGGMVDTLAFNRRAKDYAPEELDLIREALDLIREGVQRRDLSKLGRAGGISARVNQRLLPKPELDGIMMVAREHGALGICVGHSGTVVSALFDARSPGLEKACAALTSRLNGKASLLVTRTTSLNHFEVQR